MVCKLCAASVRTVSTSCGFHAEIGIFFFLYTGKCARVKDLQR